MVQTFKSDFFHGLSETDIAEVLMYFEEAEFLKDTMLMNEGEKGAEMVLIMTGRVSVKVQGHYVKSFGAGTIVGEISLIDNGERTASIHALTDVAVLKLITANWLRLQHEQPTIAARLNFNLNCIMAKKFRSTVGMVRQLHAEVHSLEDKLGDVSFKRFKKILTKPLF